MNFKVQADQLYSRLIEENSEGKLVYYKKRQVFPIFHRDGSIYWFNLITGGSWFRLGLAILFIIIALGFIFEYHSNLQACSELMDWYNLQQNLIPIK